MNEKSVAILLVDYWLLINQQPSVVSCS